jgi:hypothetical protein
MLGLQEWIHKLEEGNGVRFVKGFTFAIVFVALAIVYNLREFKAFSTPEAMDTSQLARNLSEGRGFTTDCIRPFGLYLLARQRTSELRLDLPQPDISNPPAYPWLLAQWMKHAPFDFAIGETKDFRAYQPEMLIAWLNQTLFLLALFILFRIAQRLFDESVAWVSVCVLVGTDLLWRFSVSGLSTMLLLVLVLTAVWCLVTADQGARDREWGYGRLLPLALLSGSLVGAAALARYAMVWFIVPVAFFWAAFLAPRRFVLTFAAVVSFAAVVTPWLLRNQELSGTPFGTAGYALYENTERFPGNWLERALNPANQETPRDLAKYSLDEHWDKLATNLAKMLQTDLPKFGGTWAAALFLGALLLSFKNATLSRLRGFLVLSLVIFIPVQALAQTHLTTLSPEVTSENLLVVFAPLVVMYGIGLFSILLDQLDLTYLPVRGAVTGTFVLILSAPLVFTFLPPRSSPFADPPYYPPTIQTTAGWFEKNELLMSDVPWAVAWYGRRPCVWLTLDIEQDFKRVQILKPVNALYLTQLTTDRKLLSEMARGHDQEWGRFALQAVANEEVPTGFPLKNAVTSLFPDQLFLADRERWLEKK